MPVQKCKRKGKSGHKVGRRGGCVTRKGSKKIAQRQQRAIRAKGGR